VLIVADENIPLLDDLFGRFGAVRALPGVAIDAAAVRDADALLVRSVTRVDRALLAGSAVRFVGSATIGTDHVDRAALASGGVAFAHAPGSNAESVVEYVLAALLAAFSDRGLEIAGRTLGIVGLGQIGSRLAARASALGLTIFRNDPPLAAAGGSGYVSLSHVLDAADIITLHCPLTGVGDHPTHHLIDERVLARMRPTTWLVNAARGPVVDNRALAAALHAGRIGGAILDVWEGEPLPDPELIEACALATPHIAGYSVDGKLAGAVMLARALAEHLGEPVPEPPPVLTAADLPPLAPPPAGRSHTARLDAIVRQMYDVRADDAALRAAAPLAPPGRAARFHELRRTYPPRRRFQLHRLAEEPPPELRRAVEEGLRIGADRSAGVERR
jgi:erythronate-4-phosphate dehydrogenase